MFVPLPVLSALLLVATSPISFQPQTTPHLVLLHLLPQGHQCLLAVLISLFVAFDAADCIVLLNFMTLSDPDSQPLL